MNLSPVAPVDFSSPDFSIPSIPHVSRFVLERAEHPNDVVRKIFSCNHIGTRLTVRQIKSGPRRAHQCLRCGAMTNAPITDEHRAKSFSDLPSFNEDLKERFNQAQSDAYALASVVSLDKLQQQRNSKNRQWWDWYNQYTQSGQWQNRRQKVLERDSYRCQACLEKEATEIHHLNYDHVGNEPLFDLIAVCHSCHESITEMDRKRRSVAL